MRLCGANPETPSAAPVVIKTRTRSANLSAVLGPVWKWLVEKNTELNPWTSLKEPCPDFIVIREERQFPRVTLCRDFTSL